MYCIKSGSEINEILEHGINEEKRKVFKELDNGSLNKILLILVVDVMGGGLVVVNVTIVPLLTIFMQNFEEGENYLSMRLAKY